MTDNLNQLKIDFIEYLLFQYEFKSRISVWTLNYLKSSLQQAERIHFVDSIVNNHVTLTLATIQSNSNAITLQTNTQLYKNSNEIFNFIANSSFAIDIKIDFGTQLRRERRLDELLVAQLLQSPYYITYFNDIYTIPLSKHKENTIIANLQENIDLSLQMNDKDLFYQLTQILNIFKHRNHNSTMRD
ncbi:IDEAL domain-containing protein [Staphylococcus arlettae]|uniref:Cytosolic protein n=5 Tax=Staphylococcus arlettae TaxID=29378 RepID=A0A2T7BW34_9STAP|nr:MULTISPECIES: YpiB family protein [Staphylococcus]EJY94858.1 hypothetical protein SARL_12596 [Staphylococcus arlettae CVD059]ERF49851.1 hypothetical protein N039_00185 [Staphylococcus sp. EGD-HP3]KAB2480058.1 IDEAL domain-containing protein [Staphylococcus sp. CH99b_3]MBF0737551.1 YpiB family protein [Staphylococcus arlettae]MBK3718624.1 hypothetical protein [Staphylococcus arlettae]